MGKATPAPPDYTGAAQAQAAASAQNVMTQNYANRPIVNTPFGTQTWDTAAVTDPATGQQVTQWTQNIALPSNLQDALQSQIDTQLGRSDLASGFMGRVGEAYKKPFDWQNLPSLTSPGTPGELQTNVADYAPGLTTAYNFGNAPAAPTYDTNYRDKIAQSLIERMAPVQQYQQSQLQTQLSNQGFKQGTEAYKRALDELAQRQAAERYNAFDVAGQEAARQFGSAMQGRQQGISEAMAQGNLQNQALGQAAGLDLSRMGAMNQAQAQQYALNQQYANMQNQLRQQAIAEQAQQRGMSLNEMNALLSGQQVSMPQFPSFAMASQAQTPDLLGAAKSQYQSQLDAFNAKQAGTSGLMSGIFGLGSAYLGNPFSFQN